MSVELQVKHTWRKAIYLAILALLAGLLAWSALMVPLFSSLLEPSITVGKVADQDYRATQTITYESKVLTQQRRDQAVNSVATVYTAPDTNVARQQLESLRTSLAYISSVRADTYASQKQKMQDLAALEDINLSQETASGILALNDSRWQTVQQEAIVVLEQVMRNTIRPDRVDDARNSLPNLVSLSLPEQQAEIVAQLAAAFVAPNSMPSESLTDAARKNAVEAVQPVTRTFVAGETVVPRGKVLNAADVEALQSLGLKPTQESWQSLISTAGLVLVFLFFIGLYLYRSQSTIRELRSLALITILFLVFLFGARLSIPGHTVLPYAYPLAAYGLIVASLFGAQVALVSSLPLAVLVAYGLPNALDLTLYFVMGSLFGVLTLGRARRLTDFLWAGTVIALTGIAVILVYRLPLPTTDWIGLASLAGTSMFNGLASASLAVLLQFLLAQLLGMTTPMQLMELTRPDHPLLQLILREAPGTYQHCLQVANLAEQAADRIGADTLLTRVGALYHDAGKIVNPIYFIENQVPGMINPHDDLDPATSAATIIRHVPDGMELARKYRLPRRISDFISEHHGTMITRYQYVQAVTEAGGDEDQVDIEQFRYPGPRPQSRETAILMLADGSEARVRAEKPKEEEELRDLIKGVIENRMAIGQLDDTNLTLKDLSAILDSFTTTLRGIYHPRVKYPKLEKTANPELPAPTQALPPAARSASDVSVSKPADSSSTAS